MSYITVVTPKSSFCGKLFSLGANNKIVKENRANAPAKSFAQTVECSSLKQLAEIINRLDIGQAIILGYVPETVGIERFHLWSVSQMKGNFEEFGELCEKERKVERSRWIITKNNEVYLPRKKHLFARSPFFCIDRDVDENAPDKIKSIQSLSNNDFLRVMCNEISDEVSSAFYGADFLPVASSSSQVYTEDGKPYTSDPSAHIFFHVENPDDIERFGAALFAHAMASGYSYNKEINRKDNVNAFRKQTIFDPSVFTNGRLFFESSPRVSHGLKTHKSDCVTFSWSGKSVCTEMVKDPDQVMLENLKEQGIAFHRSAGSSHFSSEGLHQDLIVETKDHGSITVGQYSASGLTKVRCQTPFRDSTSWAAYLNKHDDGEPYLWDEGSRTKYRLVKDDKELIETYEMAMKAVRNEVKGRMKDAIYCDDEVSDDIPLTEKSLKALEEDLNALVDFHEEQSLQNVYPINDQYDIDSIKKPKPRESAFNFFNGNDLEAMDLRKPEDMYIWGDGALVKGGLTLFGGVPKVGKSSLLMSLLMAAACGGSFLGYRFNREQKVLWFQAELMTEMFKARYDDAITSFSRDEKKKIKNNLVVSASGSKQMNGAHNFDYKEAIEEYEPDLVAIDPLRNLISIQNESDPTEMIAALSSIKETATNINKDVSVIIVHHLRKVSQVAKNDPFDLFSGSGALRGYYDTGLVMLADEELTHDRHLHWEIRNGKPIEKMHVSHVDGIWERNGGLLANVREKTKSSLNDTEILFKDTLVSLLKADKVIGKDNAVPWSEVKSKLNLILSNREVSISDSTMNRYAKQAVSIHMTTEGKGRRSKIYYDGSKA